MLCVGGAPIISRIYPTWGLIGNDINIEGTGFSATVALNSVSASGYPCVIQSATTELIVCHLEDESIPRANALDISVSTSSVVSNSKPFGLIEIGGYGQNNKFYNWTGGVYSSIPDKSKIAVRSVDLSVNIPVTYEDHQNMYFILNVEMAKQSEFQLIDSSTNSVVSLYKPLLGFYVIVDDVKFYENSMVITGFAYTSTTTVTTSQIMGQNDPCTITSFSDTSITCTPVSTYFINTMTYPFTIIKSGILKVFTRIPTFIQGYENLGVDICNLNVSSTNLGQTIRIIGLNPTPIVPTTTTISTTDTIVSFTYPLNAQCGYAFVSTDDSTSFQRLTNSMIICPTPTVQTVIAKPDSSNNNIILFNGIFLNEQLYGNTITTTISYTIQFGGGAIMSCSNPSHLWIPANSTYTASCQVSATPTTSFMLIAATLDGQSSSILVGYQPTITGVSKTDYKVPGVITITGSAFSSLDLTVLIGGSQCVNPVVQGDGLQMTCTFGSDVTVVDFSKPLEVFVSIGSTYNDKKSLFYYNRPTPTISSSTRTYFGVPGTVTITGTYLYSTNLVVTIGGSPCTSPLSAPDGNSIACQFDSSVILTIPLEVSVTIDSTYTAKNSVFYYELTTPTLVGSTSTVYGTSGLVTITGTSFYNFGLVVTIGGATCSTPIASEDNKEITCQFAGVTVTDIKNPLEVSVTIATNYNAKKSVFYYTLATPTITSSTKSLFGTPAIITITGNSFFNFDLVVLVGGSICNNAIASQDNKQITCTFKSDVAAGVNTPLEVHVSMNTNIEAKANVFYYAKPTQVSISSSTSTKYGVPGIVTIFGNNFINNQLLVKIGGSECTNALATQDSKQLTCRFKSDVVAAENTVLDVFVSVQSLFNATEPVFLYIKSDQNCPIGSNGQECSGHGTCEQQYLCKCNKDWESSDCSIPNNGGGTVIPDPNVNPNDTSSTIITPGGTMFDVGIVLIQEIDSDHNIVQSYNVTSIKWTNITKQDNQHIYTTTLPNNQSTLNVKLSINNLDENVYYNFAGDVIPILPKSIKYQVELQNYTFSSSLNTMQFIFKSGILQEGGECVYESDTNTQPTSGDSIRSILMMLNGETLIGTFSNRIVLDNRPSYNQVNKLTDTQINQYNLNSQSLYVAITTTSFKNDVVVDPNFGVLVTSTPDNQNQCNKKFAAWKIAMIVVCCVVGVALLIATVMLIKKRAVVKAFNAKLKKLDNHQANK
ncbi:hypothetical protein CYY_000779 [Polysphondylium violaceum]|uniref:EGF-like domain-containing protein n=1 Tax=Polysphondylium violaceum TaxID=133409 RepID=A0A8J4Q164_9MYCE|nr:hypothetical protein CYY_000779 [Polysphondylium violaceum]